MSGSAFSFPPFPSSPTDWALFLDVDGTLADFAPRPEQVVIAPAVLDALASLLETLDGALAIVSGRPVAQIDALFAPLVLPAAGLHGLERRLTPDGPTERAETPAWHGEVAARLARFADDHDGPWVEDKGATVALHYRGAPQLDEAAHALAREIAAMKLPGLSVQAGKMIVEFRPAGADKGNVIEYFLAEPPFAGRMPVFVGDDLTDEDGFRAVKARGGHAIRVGSHGESVADWYLPSVKAAEGWIRDLAAALRGPTPVETA